MFFTKSPKYYFEQQLELMAASSVARLSQPNLENQIGSIGNGGAKTNGMMKAVGKLNRTAKGGDGNGELGASVRFGDDVSGYRNMRTTWRVNFEPEANGHYANYPTKLIEIPIKAGSPVGGIIYDPFGGTATTAVVAHRLGRQWICSELKPQYADIANQRLEPYLMQEQLF